MRSLAAVIVVAMFLGSTMAVLSTPATGLATGKSSRSSNAGAPSPGAGRAPSTGTPEPGNGVTPSVSSTPNWTQIVPPSPPALTEASMAYDAKDGYTVLFGGNLNAGSVMYNGTWAFKNSNWTNLTKPTKLSARSSAAMAYDAADKYVVLFGGTNGTTVLADTWKFTGGTWTRLFPTTSPPARAFASMSYDAQDGYLVLFGGLGKTTILSDTWEFKGGVWTKLTPLTHPSMRISFAMSYDAHDREVLLFGGYAAGGKSLGDAWVFSGGNWTSLHFTGGPAARWGAGLGFSALDQEVILFGGINSSASKYYSDSWTFSGGNWTKLGPAFHPSSRTYPAVTDSAPGGRLLVYGGYSYVRAAVLDDTWAYHADVWQRVVAFTPSPRVYSSMTYDEADGYVLLFGGQSSALGGTFFGDTWKFSGGAWTALRPATSPSPRTGASMVYDSADGYVLLFGGSGCSTGCGDTWSFVGGTWTQILPGSGPSAQAFAAISYDAADGYVLFFGTAGDTWSYYGGAWTLQAPTTSPPVRSQAAMTYDSEDGYVLLFSGWLNFHIYKDTWTYVGGVWTNITASVSGSPPGGISMGFVDDTYDGFPFLFTDSYGSQNWEFTTTSWTGYTISTPTFPLIGEGIAYDAIDHKVVVFGGDSTSLSVISGATLEFGS